MDYILSAASFGAFFFALLLLGKKSKSLHDRVLFGWVNLAIGMLVHELSVLAVILNALRLVKYNE